MLRGGLWSVSLLMATTVVLVEAAGTGLRCRRGGLPLLTKSGTDDPPWRLGLGDRGDLSVGGTSSSLRSMRAIPREAADTVCPTRCQHDTKNSASARILCSLRRSPSGHITPAVRSRKIISNSVWATIFTFPHYSQACLYDTRGQIYGIAVLVVYLYSCRGAQSA